jgi:hypothetical protein
MQRVAIVENNVVINVILLKEGADLPDVSENLLYIPNDWVGPGDWWEESEGRFYRAIPNNEE